MSEAPLVTVLMAVFNDADFLADAVNGILAQTLRSFEFLIIDDGSTDDTSRILASFSDARIHVLRNERNQGLTASLKGGLPLARGKYIARMDADDIALPTRLEKQVRFLEAQPDIGLVGTGCFAIDEGGHVCNVLEPPATDLEMRWIMLRHSPLIHPSAVIRHEVLAAHALNYDEGFQTTQDYDLWTRLLRTTRGANLREPLLKLRSRPGVSEKRWTEQNANRTAIALRTVRHELPDCSIPEAELRRLVRVVPGREDDSSNMHDWLDHACGLFRLFEQFRARHQTRPAELRPVAALVAAEIGGALLVSFSPLQQTRLAGKLALRCPRLFGLLGRHFPRLVVNRFRRTRQIRRIMDHELAAREREADQGGIHPPSSPCPLHS